MIVDFRRNPPALTPLTIMNSTVTAVESFRLLGTTISITNHIEVQPTTGTADTVLLCHHWISPLSITVWFTSATKSDLKRLRRVVRTAERIIDTTLPTLQELYLSRVSKRAGKITLDPSHPAHSLFELLPSGRRYRALSTRTTRHRNSFFPQAIHLMNTWQ